MDVDSMVSLAHVGMNKGLAALKHTNPAQVFTDLIDLIMAIRQRIMHKDEQLKTGINNYNVMVAHLIAPTVPKADSLSRLKNELEILQRSVEEIIESIKVLQENRRKLAEERGQYQTDQAQQQRKDRQQLTDMRSLVLLYQSISNVQWDSARRCFYLSSGKAKLLGTADTGYMRPSDSGNNSSVWDLLAD